MQRLRPDRFTVATSHAGDVNVHVRASSRWKVLDGKGCVTSTNDGWTVLRVFQPGRVHVTQSLGGTQCPDS